MGNAGPMEKMGPPPPDPAHHGGPGPKKTGQRSAYGTKVKKPNRGKKKIVGGKIPN